MPQLLPSGRVIRFGLFEADLESGELRKEGLPTKLQGRPFEILSILLEQPGRVVTREEFRRRLWPADTFVDFDHSLNVSINKLRQALGDTADNPRFVATAGRRGYRFIAPAERLNYPPIVAAPAETVLAETKDPDIQSTPLPGKTGRRRLTVTISVLALAIVAFALIGFFRSSPQPQVKRVVQMTHVGTVSRDQLLTDGPRLYFRAGVEGQGSFQQMPVEGGESGAISGIRSDFIMEDLSLGTAELLLVDRDETHGALWAQSLVSNSGRRLGGMSAYAAVWSPDGRRVAYMEGLDLYVANNDGSDAHKLVTLPRRADCLRWSPDGTRLRFLEDDPRPQQTSLWQVGSDGSGVRPLLPSWSESAREGCGNWSIDGRYFFFESAHEGSRDIWAIRESTPWFGARSREPVRLTSGPLNFFAPTPSRDGRRLFVVGEQRRGELTRYNEKSKLFEAFLGGISVSDVQFSHDGKWIAYVTYPDRTLWRSRADGTERLQLTAPQVRASLPAWSPDDQRILFQAISSPNRPWKLYVIHPNGGAPEMLISDPDSQEASATWLPDGNTVAYTYNSVSSQLPDSSLEIRVLDLSTRLATTVPGSQGLYAPEWSPDGRYLTALLGGKDSLMLFDKTTQKWMMLLSLGVGYPSWSRDGQYVYCNTLWRQNPALIRVAVNSRKVESFPVNFAAAGTFGAWSGLTPDGSFLLLHDRGTRDIYYLDLILP